MSPESRSGPTRKHTDPRVWPGVCTTSMSRSCQRSISPSLQVLLAHDIGQVIRNTGKVVNRLELLAIIGMDRGLATECGLHRRHAADVVGMPMGEQDAIAAQSALLQQRERLRVLQSRVDDQRVGRVAPAQHVAVLVERRVDDDGELDEVAQRVGHDRKTTRGWR